MEARGKVVAPIIVSESDPPAHRPAFAGVALTAIRGRYRFVSLRKMKE